MQLFKVVKMYILRFLDIFLNIFISFHFLLFHQDRNCESKVDHNNSLFICNVCFPIVSYENIIQEVLNFAFTFSIYHYYTVHIFCHL